MHQEDNKWRRDKLQEIWKVSDEACGQMHYSLTPLQADSQLIQVLEFLALSVEIGVGFSALDFGRKGSEAEAEAELRREEVSMSVASGKNLSPHKNETQTERNTVPLSLFAK